MLHEGTHRPSSLSHLATSPRPATPDPRRTALVVVAFVLLFGAALTMWPFAAPLVLGAWAAHLSRPLFRRVRVVFGGRERAAGLLTALLVVVAIAPLAIAIMTLIPAGQSLLEQLRGASGGRDILATLVSGGGGEKGPLTVEGVVQLAKEYGASASRALAIVAKASVAALIGAFVFFTVFYSLLVDGEKWYAWLRAHAPIEPRITDRLNGAFHQAGRGLIVGTGLTALIQGGLATALFMAFGIPRAFLLGMLSIVAALIPMAGPMLVWVPVSLGLAFTGHPAKAALLAALCAGLVGTIDNVIRPWLSRRFNVGMPATVVLVAMLGGVIVFGGWGLFIGPLLVRLAGEVLELSRSHRLFGRATSEPGAPPTSA